MRTGRPPASAGVTARSLVFTAWLYGSMALLATLASPLLLFSRQGAWGLVRIWVRTVLWGLRVFCDVRVEVRGREHMPTGPALVAAKHQSMLDTVAPLDLLADPAYVLKRELMRLPFFGWWAGKLDMLPIDREGGSNTLRALVHRAKDRLSDGRQVVIFPEGTRQEPGAAPDYKPGVAGLYRELGVPCVPVATNSGLHWPPHGFLRFPGTVVYEFLPPIAPGMKRASFMAVLEDRIEGASDRLLPTPPVG